MAALLGVNVEIEGIGKVIRVVCRKEHRSNVRLAATSSGSPGWESLDR